MGGETPVRITRLPISLPCPVPVVAGTPNTRDDDGEPIPLDERTERCAVDAFWMMGLQVTCDVHLRDACEVGGIDFDGVVAEAGGLFSSEQKPWADRHRYSQDEAERIDRQSEAQR